MLPQLAVGARTPKPKKLMYASIRIAPPTARVTATMIGAFVVGSVLAPLGTFYSLRLDALAPLNRKAEVFALSRTANSLGVIVASATLTWASLQATQVTSAIMIFTAAAAVKIASLPGSRARI